jgi:ribonuclease-3 family protein
MIDFLNGMDINPRELSPLVLAYIGDAIFELLVRGEVLKNGNAPVNKLNNKARKIVNAASQSAMYSALEEIVTEEELAVLKRGRNAKSFTTAKNQSVTDYRRATGVEALFGYVYLKGESERVMELFKICMNNKNT